MTHPHYPFKQTDMENIVVDGVTQFDSGKIADTHLRYVKILAENADIRVCACGTPSATVGYLLTEGNTLEVWGEDIADFKMIKVDDAANVSALYYGYVNG